jgi:hypothetical protein
VVGLVCKQHATAGKAPVGLAKRRRLPAPPADPRGSALVRVSPGRTGKLWSWIGGLLARRPFNVVVAAVANKLARILWAMLSRGEAYRAAA